MYDPGSSENEEHARDIQAKLADRFPKYASLAYPRPVKLAEVQAVLEPGEVVVQFLLADEVGFAWALTRDTAISVRLPTGKTSVADLVGVLRCGLDSGEWQWNDGRWQAEREQCRGLEADRNARPGLPFKPEIAHKLYEALFAPLESALPINL